MSGIKFTEAAMAVLKKRYFLKDKDGNPIEDAEKMFSRVANDISKAEYNYSSNEENRKIWESKFYEVMTNFNFLPSTPVLFNAGTPVQQLNACFVLPITDTLSNGMDGILDTMTKAAIIHKTGGGTGFDFSKIRPANSEVNGTGGVASGPVSFMKAYDSVTEVIKQGGKRRGANIGILRCDHPNIFEFLDCKKEEGSISNFNISVALTDNFLKAVKTNSNWDLIWNEKIYKTVKAKEIWNKIIDGAWKNGEPGILFIDTFNKYNVVPSLGSIAATNPCGELGLLAKESCLLGSINLSNMYDEVNSSIDYQKLKDIVNIAVRFLDNVIDRNQLPLTEIVDMTKSLRRMGLGIMGFADLLIKLKVRYGSEDSYNIAKDIISFIKKEAYKYSETLAIERGPFPYFEKEPELKKQKPRRNVTLLSIAPTGTISMIANCSSGIEPIFALEMNKNVLDTSLDMDHSLYTEWKKNNKERSHPNYFITAKEIPYTEHVKMQAIFQNSVCTSISKTINFHFDATKEDIEHAYMLAWELGCKGMTVYRDGSRNIQVLVSKNIEKASESVEKSSAKGRPMTLNGITDKYKTGEGDAYITVNEFEGKPFEVFIQIGKSGANTSANSEAVGRLTSLCLRAGVNPKDIIKQLSDITGSNPTWNEHSLVKSVPDAIAKMLSKVICESEIVIEEKTASMVVCEECGKDSLIFEEGCFICRNLECGYSKCSG